MKLPKTVYVRIDKETNSDEYLSVFASTADAVDGDGPTTIGVYTLTQTVIGRKYVDISERPK